MEREKKNSHTKKVKKWIVLLRTFKKNMKLFIAKFIPHPLQLKKTQVGFFFIAFNALNDEKETWLNLPFLNTTKKYFTPIWLTIKFSLIGRGGDLRHVSYALILVKH